MSDKKQASKSQIERLKPITLYDHLPGILAGYPAVCYFIIAILTYPNRAGEDGGRVSWWPEALSNHMFFWIGVSIAIIWYIAFRFNLPKAKFWLAFGLFGTFVGIPVVLEITGIISPFQSVGKWLGHLKPEANASAWLVIAVCFTVIWISNFVWSRTHQKVRIDESGLTITRIGGKSERFDLIGLKTETEPIDYLEMFIAGIGSLSLKSRLNKPIFTMKRVVGLYWSPLWPFAKGKLARIEEMLSYQGKVVSVDREERAELADAMEADGDEADNDDDAFENETIDSGPASEQSDVDTPDKPDIS